MMTVSDIVGATEDERERISDEQLRRGVDDMMRVACRVADQLTSIQCSAPTECLLAESPRSRHSDAANTRIGIR